MPSKPNQVKLNGKSIDILNAIRNNGSSVYRENVPLATGENIQSIGTVITGNPTLANEFLHALVNRIGRVIISSKLYDNPWAMFKKGELAFGESVEDIFVNIAKAHTYNIEKSEKEVFKREIPDVKSAFHMLNYKKFYKATIQQEQLRQAFLSMDGVTDLIGRIVDSMYTGANYDEFVVMKYMLAKRLLNGGIYTETIPEPTKANAEDIVTKVKEISNNYQFMDDKYNEAGVKTYTLTDNQYVIVNTKFDSIMDVSVLASAFNMDKANFIGHKVLVDSFGNLDTVRLNELFADDPTYTEITQEQLKELDKIPALIVDINFFMIFDNMMQFTEIYNGEGLYWNYWLHKWNTFSVSPFANATALIVGEPSVTRVTVTPTTASVGAGGLVALSAEVETKNFAPQSVTWSCDDTKATVDYTGLVHVKQGLDSQTSITVTATSTFDKSKTASCTITVS